MLKIMVLHSLLSNILKHCSLIDKWKITIEKFNVFFRKLFFNLQIFLKELIKENNQKK